jgi:phage tail protein X
MRALLLALVLVGLFLLAALGQERWTERLRRTRDLALEHPVSTEEAPLDEGWSLLVVGRPSGTEPLPYPEHGWASSAEVVEEEAAPGKPLAAETDPTPGAKSAPDFVYRVQHGDTLGVICQGHYGTSRRELLDSVASYNGLDSPDDIREGALLYLPDLAGL